MYPIHNGETVKAVYSAKQDIDEEALKAYLEEHLAKFKIPRIFEKWKRYHAMHQVKY